MINALLKGNRHDLGEKEVARLAEKTEGFSGADLKSLCNDASMGPIRELGKVRLTAA
jgi:fidgetin-like protein 1